MDVRTTRGGRRFISFNPRGVRGHASIQGGAGADGREGGEVINAGAGGREEPYFLVCVFW